MACTFCNSYCEGACFPLHQIRQRTFPEIFNPQFTREKQARGFAAVLKAFQIRSYPGPHLSVLITYARDMAGRKTIDRALQLLDDPFIVEVAEKMAAQGFKERDKFKIGKREVIV